MPTLQRCLPFFAASLSVLAQLEPAHACGALPCAQVSDVQPEDGSVGVPRNTELRVLYFGSLESYDTCELDLRPMRLVPAQGEPIYLTGTLLPRAAAQQAWTVAQHVEPLAADTEYALELLMLGGVEVCSCEPREWTAVAHFTTGGALDDEAPSFAGLEGVDYGERLRGSSDCGTSDRVPVYLTFDTAAEASPGKRYDIYVDGELAKRYVDLSPKQELNHTEIFIDCGSGDLSTATNVRPGAKIEARAVDLAGNESPPNAELTLADRCQVVLDEASPPPDDGAAPNPDGNEISANESEPPCCKPLSTPAASGCALGVDAGAGASSLAALLLLACLRRRRPRGR